uniref:Reticulon-like protein n=1 Tax=Riptortus pedestris TaxID=329032 RepID=R4WCX9_RIPPE|nr:reticulon/nogo [Riptortus pedestris]
MDEVKEVVEEVAAEIASAAKEVIAEIAHHQPKPKHEEECPFKTIDAWFNPARLHPQVESLVYWRDPKKSGIVFGILMVTLLSLTTFSLISVVAYLGLLTLAGTISFRIYKNIMQAVQKTSDGHPFKNLLDIDISLPEDKVAEISRLATQHVNAAISALRSLFLVEDLVDSIKGLVLFWALTYVGAVFNGLTLLIIGVLLVFSLPRLYEKNKDQVDAYIQIAMDKLSIVTNRMRAAIPSGKKDEKPKDQ